MIMQVRLNSFLVISSAGGGKTYTCGALTGPLGFEMVFSMGDGRALLLTLHLNATALLFYHIM